jgi:lysophospholipase L1-like esterase
MDRTIIVVGDSLACPRPWEGINLQSTYAFQLHAKLDGNNFIANYGASDNSSSKAIKESFLRTYVRAADADYAIVQLGIVDCAPRLLGAFERAIGYFASRIALFRPLFKIYIKLKSQYRYPLTRIFPQTLVSINEFEANYRILLTELLEHNPIKKIFLINIAYPGTILLERSFNILENIKAYNNVISKFGQNFPEKIEIVDLYRKTETRNDWITPDDGHHIYSPAHAWIAAVISENILNQDRKCIPGLNPFH